MSAFDVIAGDDRAAIDDAVLSAGAPDGWASFVQSEIVRSAVGGLTGSPSESGRVFAQLVSLAESLGAAGCQTRLHGGLVLALATIAEGDASVGVSAAGEEHIARVLTGTRYATCVTDVHGVFRTGEAPCTVVHAGSAWQVTGSSGFVAYATDAETFLVVARDASAGVHVFAIAADSAGVRIEPLDTVADDGRAIVHFADVVVAESQRVGMIDAALRRAVDLATVVLCAEMVGAARAMIERTAAHVRTRKQFGAALSSLPAVQHRLADMAMDYETAAGSVLEAVRAVERGQPFEVEAAAAKVSCTVRCARIVVGAHRLCGGQGYLASAGLHEYTRFLKAAESTYEPPLATRARLASLLAQHRFLR